MKGRLLIRGGPVPSLDETVGTLPMVDVSVEDGHIAAIGQDADIVLGRADAVNTFPVVDPVATVVTSADTSNVDTVLLRGEFRKRAGVLVGVDMARLRSLVEQGRDHVLASAGMTPAWVGRADAARTGPAVPGAGEAVTS